MVVVPRVAEDHHRRLRADLLALALPEDLEGVAVVGVAVDPHDVGLGVDAVDRLADVLDALEHPGHLVDAVDEDERAHLGELARDRVHEVEREAGERGHRPEMSAMTKISGFDGRGYLNFGSAGTPP